MFFMSNRLKKRIKMEKCYKLKWKMEKFCLGIRKNRTKLDEIEKENRMVNKKLKIEIGKSKSNRNMETLDYN